jgi:hypothetical protein
VLFRVSHAPKLDCCHNDRHLLVLHLMQINVQVDLALELFRFLPLRCSGMTVATSFRDGCNTQWLTRMVEYSCS